MVFKCNLQRCPSTGTAWNSDLGSPLDELTTVSMATMSDGMMGLGLATTGQGNLDTAGLYNLNPVDPPLAGNRLVSTLESL